MGKNLSLKLIEKNLLDPLPQDTDPTGKIVRCKVDMVLANDVTAPLAIDSFFSMDAKEVFDREKIALVMDHFTPQKDIESANQVKKVRTFAREMGIVNYFEGGNCGVEHALLPELGLVGPGDIVVGADSHTCTYGGIGAFGTGMGSTDIAAAMALGETWFKIPPTIRVNIHGHLNRYVGGKDLILTVIGRIGVDGATYRALEFGGPVIESLDVEDRLCMANMAIEAGAKCGLFASDEKTLDYMSKTGRKKQDLPLVSPDPDAEYEMTLDLYIDNLEPVVAEPHLPSNVRPAREVKLEDGSPVPLDQVFIGSCTNGRISDLRRAAAILSGRKVSSQVRCIVLPATPGIWAKALKEGLLETFLQAGCVIGPPSCGPCLGGHLGILANGERALATSNRNFRGRMGSLEAQVYLSGPEVAAASAVTGVISHPDDL